MVNADDQVTRTEQPSRNVDQIDARAAQYVDKQEVGFATIASASQRARESLLKAADVARHLSAASRNATASSATPRTVSAESLFNVDHNTRNVHSDSTDSTEPSQQVKFLGFGQLQKIEVNGRRQARLSCQFGDATASNMSIANVEWAKFEGQYDVLEPNPPFGCPIGSSSCRLIRVKTDTTTTVHPRPAIQNYINVLVPSYSLTLHEVSDEQLGVYRCSAMRQWQGRDELVFRLIPFE